MFTKPGRFLVLDFGLDFLVMFQNIVDSILWFE